MGILTDAVLGVHPPATDLCMRLPLSSLNYRQGDLIYAEVSNDGNLLPCDWLAGFEARNPKVGQDVLVLFPPGYPLIVDIVKKGDR